MERLGVPGRALPVGARARRSLESGPERSWTSRGLSVRGFRRRDQPAHVQRGWRQHDPLHGDLDSPRSVRLPGADTRRRRRRLADLLRGSAALLRAGRHRPGRFRARRRSRLPARLAAAAPTAPDRGDGAEGRGGDEPARLALVAGDECDRVAPARSPGPMRAACDVSERVSVRREGLDRPDALARCAPARSPARHGRSRARDRARPARPGARRGLRGP